MGPRERLYKLRPTIKLGSLARGPEGAEVVAGGVVEVSQRVPAGKSLFWEPEVLVGLARGALQREGRSQEVLNQRLVEPPYRAFQPRSLSPAPYSATAPSLARAPVQVSLNRERAACHSWKQSGGLAPRATLYAARTGKPSWLNRCSRPYTLKRNISESDQTKCARRKVSV